MNYPNGKCNWCSMKIVTVTLLALQIVLNNVNGDSTKYTDYCRSINSELGKCVTLDQCPLFFNWIHERPIVKQKLKYVVTYTCYFDLYNPKVCCPLRQIDPEGGVIKSKSSFGDSSPALESPNSEESEKTPRDLGLDKQTSSSPPDLIFPKDDEEYESKRKSKAKFVYYTNKLTFDTV